MQTSNPSEIVTALLENDIDPKAVALRAPDDSELFDEFMSNYVNECRKLIKAAHASHALSDGIPEGVLIRMVMQIAANNFRILAPQYKKELRNLERFI